MYLKTDGEPRKGTFAFQRLVASQRNPKNHWLQPDATNISENDKVSMVEYIIEDSWLAEAIMSAQGSKDSAGHAPEVSDEASACVNE